MLDHALWYIQNGYSVFPVAWWPTGSDNKGKKPLVEWQTYQTKKATGEEVTQWWTKWPEAAIGFVTGKINGVIVVDAERNADFSLFGCDKLETPTVRTGGGGKHFYFAYEPIRNSTRFAPFYDIRGDGGYVIMPPSKHESGGTYEWIIPLGSVSTAPFPDEVHRCLSDRGEQIKKSVATILSGITHEGSRNDTASRVVGSLLARFHPAEWETKAWPLLEGWNASKTSHPLDMDELRNVYESIGKIELNARIKTAKGIKGIKRDDMEYRITENGTDDVTVRIPTEDGDLSFQFTEIEQTKNTEIDSVLIARVLIPGIATQPFSGRINALSMSAREGFARQLGKAIGNGLPWELGLSGACDSLRQYLAERLRGGFFENAELLESRLLLPPFIEDKAHNILFGKGSGGKTFFALRLALAHMTGLPFLGFTPERTGKVLYVDYEASDSEIMDRVYRLCGSQAFDPPLESIYGKLWHMEAGGIPLIDLVPSLKKLIKRDGYDLIVVDSAAPACGGEPEKAESATRYFNALSKLGIASLTIAHETKLENHAYPFGSVFWWNLPRNIWNVQSEKEEDDRITQMGIFHRKCNNGALHRPIATKLFFGEGFIDLGFGDSGLWEKEMSVTSRIVRLMKDGVERTKQDMKRDGLNDVEENTLNQSIKRLRKSGKLACKNEGSGKWGVPPGVHNGVQGGVQNES